MIPSIPHQNPHSGIPIECQVDFVADTTNIYQSLLKRFQSDAEFIIRNNKGLLADIQVTLLQINMFLKASNTHNTFHTSFFTIITGSLVLAVSAA